MTLSLFDEQLFEKVLKENYSTKETFTKTDILAILNEMTKTEKYYPRGPNVTGEKFRVMKYFVRYCLYRNLANHDTLLLLTGPKGCIFLDEEIRIPDGIKSFKDMNLKNEDYLKVLAYDFKNDKEVISEAQFFNTGKQRTYDIELEDGRTVTATAKHTFFVQRNNTVIEVKLRDIKLTDKLVTTND